MPFQSRTRPLAKGLVGPDNSCGWGQHQQQWEIRFHREIDSIIPEFHFHFGLLSVVLGTNHIGTIVPRKVCGLVTPYVANIQTIVLSSVRLKTVTSTTSKKYDECLR
ncbi:UNC93-like protein 1 [Fusarium oxysporum f. sp. albedinis]|nr:UNC93-like protein 1 [Fusarium oxysporum f. sp. albedinis]